MIYRPGMCVMIETYTSGETNVDWYGDHDTAYDNNSAFAGVYPYWHGKACSNFVTLSEASALIYAIDAKCDECDERDNTVRFVDNAARCCNVCRGCVT